jgi:signal transduction histidine kinase
VPCRLRRHDGAYPDALLVAAPRLGVDGVVQGYVGSVVVAALDPARPGAGEPHEAESRTHEFLRMLAHELRNPLAPLRNGLATLRRPAATEQIRAQSIALMGRQLTRLSHLVDQLGDVSRMLSGSTELHPAPARLQAIVDAALEIVRPVLEERRHRVALVLPEAPVPLVGDEARLVQVVANLLHNSAKYTPAHGDVALSAVVEGDALVLRVRDSGIGMEPGTLAGVFDMFSRPGMPARESQGGLGIGLPLARHLVELHGGTIAAHSDGVGRGSEFVVRLPLAPHAAAAAPAARPARDGRTDHAAASAARVLIVDDNADVRAGVADLLGALGYDVRTAADADSAMSVAERWRPTHVLIDLNMPLANGFDVARSLRARFAVREMRLVLMSGVALNDVLKESARSAGFDAFVDKMAEPEQWADVLRSDDGPAPR